MVVIPYKTWTPQLHPSVFVAETAVVIGNTVIGEGSSVWFHTVVRGDVHAIRIGARTNIQDHCTLHVTTGKWPLAVGDDVTVGHGVILHGCTIEDRCLIGMGSTVMDGAVIEAGSIVGAGSLVTEKTRVPAGHLALGRPATVKRPLTPAETASLVESARHYAELARTYKINPA